MPGEARSGDAQERGKTVVGVGPCGGERDPPLAGLNGLVAPSRGSRR